MTKDNDNVINLDDARQADILVLLLRQFKGEPLTELEARQVAAWEKECRETPLPTWEDQSNDYQWGYEDGRRQAMKRIIRFVIRPWAEYMIAAADAHDAGAAPPKAPDLELPRLGWQHPGTEQEDADAAYLAPLARRA